MPDFERVARFELIHYMVNYDIWGKLSEYDSDVPDFPGRWKIARVKVRIPRSLNFALTKILGALP